MKRHTPILILSAVLAGAVVAAGPAGATTTAAPTFSPAAGTYAVAQTVAISDATAGATIYYTTNGTTPTSASTPYSGPIAVQATEALEAIAIAPGDTASAVVRAKYSIEPPAATPTLSKAGGIFNSSQTVTISDATANAVIHYTLDGSTPTSKSPVYSSPLVIAASGRLKALATAPGHSSSAVVSAKFLIVRETVLHAFSGGINGSTDGAYPALGYGLVQAGDGNFYGVTDSGGLGTEGSGVLYQVTPAGAESVLYEFPDEECGGLQHLYCQYPSVPQETPIVGGDGALYGVALNGGFGFGDVYRMSLAGVPSLLALFGAQPGIESTDAQLMLGGDGNFYGLSYGGGASNDGVVFQVTPGGTETILHSFDGCVNPGVGADGCQPFGALVEGPDGAYYGTTAVGGTYDKGTFFKITPAGAETVLYAFGATDTDAENPTGTLILGRDGNFYGTSTGGGAAAFGTVFKASASGAVSVLYSFTSANVNQDGESPNAPLVEGPDGNFYGTTFTGGSLSAGQMGIVFEVTPAGHEMVLYRFQGNPSSGPDGGNPISGLTLGKDGNLYGVTNEGGQYGEGTVFKLTGVFLGVAP